MENVGVRFFCFYAVVTRLCDRCGWSYQGRKVGFSHLALDYGAPRGYGSHCFRRRCLARSTCYFHPPRRYRRNHLRFDRWISYLCVRQSHQSVSFITVHPHCSSLIYIDSFYCLPHCHDQLDPPHRFWLVQQVNWELSGVQV